LKRKKEKIEKYHKQIDVKAMNPISFDTEEVGTHTTIFKHLIQRAMDLKKQVEQIKTDKEKSRKKWLVTLGLAVAVGLIGAALIAAVVFTGGAALGLGVVVAPVIGAVSGQFALGAGLSAGAVAVVATSATAAAVAGAVAVSAGLTTSQISPILENCRKFEGKLGDLTSLARTCENNLTVMKDRIKELKLLTDKASSQVQHDEDAKFEEILKWAEEANSELDEFDKSYAELRKQCLTIIQKYNWPILM